MFTLKKSIFLAFGLMVLSAAVAPVQAYIDNARYEMERSRNALLDRRDQLTRYYQRLLKDSDDLNRQLDQVQSKIKYVYSDIKRTDNALTDVEYSLR